MTQGPRAICADQAATLSVKVDKVKVGVETMIAVEENVALESSSTLPDSRNDPMEFEAEGESLNVPTNATFSNSPGSSAANSTLQINGLQAPADEDIQPGSDLDPNNLQVENQDSADVSSTRPHSGQMYLDITIEEYFQMEARGEIPVYRDVSEQEERMSNETVSVDGDSHLPDHDRPNIFNQSSRNSEINSKDPLLSAGHQWTDCKEAFIETFFQDVPVEYTSMKFVVEELPKYPCPFSMRLEEL